MGHSLPVSVVKTKAPEPKLSIPANMAQLYGYCCKLNVRTFR